MESITELKQALATYLRGQSGLQKVRIMEAFAAAPRDFPLKKAVMAIGLDSMEAAPQGFGAYWGESGVDQLHGAGASITLRLEVYMPTGEDGGGLHALYEALCDALLLRQNVFGVYSVRCGETVYDRTAGAYRMPVLAMLRSALLLREQGECFEQLVVKRTETAG